jgi:hypothetical protein
MRLGGDLWADAAVRAAHVVAHADAAAWGRDCGDVYADAHADACAEDSDDATSTNSHPEVT